MDTRFHALVLRVLGLCLVFHGSIYAVNTTDAVVVEREDICVVGRDEVEGRYCAQLSLKDIDTGRGFPRHLSWLRLENTHTLLQGDAVGPLGTRMVISVKNAGSSDTSHAPSSRAELLVSMDFARTEVLLKEVLGGEAIGWAFSGPLEVDARVIRSPFKTMVLFQDEVGLGSELTRLVPKSFEDFFIPETSV